MTETPRILFLADAGPTVGGGHVMRCLTLAEALVAAGAECAFVATPAAGAVLDVFAGPAVQRFVTEDGAPGDLADQAAKAATAWGATGAVIDHYGLSVSGEAVLGARVRGVLAIDDLGRAHASDLVLDSNLGTTDAAYPGLTVLAGPEFALVRPGFAAVRDAAIARRRGAVTVRRVMVSLGLTDVGGITARATGALLPALGEVSLDVVVGGTAPSLPDLRAMARADRRLTLHVDTTEMPSLMAAADLAIGAGGSSTWERCCLGLATVTLVLADNQRANARRLARAGAAVMIEAAGGGMETQLRRAVTGLIASSDARHGLADAAARLCDGRGASRVAARMLALVNSPGDGRV